MTDDPMEPAVSTEWLAAHLGEEDLRVVDATWYLPHVKRDARAEFAEAHIPGAVFFDIDAIADRSTDLPHMLPRADDFARGVGALGIGDGDRVVASEFDLARPGVMTCGSGVSACVLAFGLSLLGRRDVAVYDGSWTEWAGRPDTPVAL